MKIFILILHALFIVGNMYASTIKNPPAVEALLHRTCNIGSDRITTAIDSKMSQKETFVISSLNGKPYIKATNLSALTAGINWYLNHYVHVNISWNNPKVDLSVTILPIPSQPDTHSTDAPYRYYLNYCTFSYSMSTWTWDRWEQEIDWMALHGINMPLQIVGLEFVWKTLLSEYYGYTSEEYNAFIAGPCFMAWFGMGNLEGWGGPNPEWWYHRQLTLAKKILARERELGMEPVLPGFSGMVPSSFEKKTGINTEPQSDWNGFRRPYILDPTSPDFSSVAQNYYSVLHTIMGNSQYYSMDPYHEGGRIESGRYTEGYKAIFEAMNQHCGKQSKWVIQQWQWYPYQATSLSAVPPGRLIVLDLYSESQPRFNDYNGYAPQEAIFCVIPNFGGRTGFFGRLTQQMESYFTFKSQYPSIKGIGAAPEAIGQVPVIYDNLYELPWLTPPSSTLQNWLREYTISRYGIESPGLIQAWENLRLSALDCNIPLQGPHEAVYCARPSLNVQSVSSWGSCNIYYDTQLLTDAVHLLTDNPITDNPNYTYDLAVLTQQALTDHTQTLLREIAEYASDTLSSEFISRRDKFLSLISQIDRLAGTCPSTRLDTWLQMMRDIADEEQGTTDADRDWLETNARILISTWGDYEQSEQGLRDYSYRAWQGMISGYYLPRWQWWFNHGMHTPEEGWFSHDWQWATPPYQGELSCDGEE